MQEGMCESPFVPEDDNETPDPVWVAIGGRFRRAMRQSGVVQEELADEAGVGQPAVSGFINAKKGIETRQLLRLLQAAGKRGFNLQAIIMDDGPVIFEFAIKTDNIHMAATLHRMADRLVSGEDSTSPPKNGSSARKRPRAANKRRKA